jgi:hypothetical protein
MTKNKEKKIQEAYQITKEEIETIVKNDDREKAIVNLIIEQAALLATQL